MKLYIGVTSDVNKICSTIYTSKEECKAVLNKVTHNGVNDGRIKIIELVTANKEIVLKT